MATKIPNCHEIIKVFQPKVFQNTLKWYFWYENTPSGNPVVYS
jgi:hypothetical protein